ncbi:acyltransferase family protein [Pedobacter duraquae]|uniref:Peptidoglycan/LPS O-acetylase OafA/YrhL n=1 Tax=Pedobacter duraquae TaxID=425511 RepID=A0A4V3C2S6_9SPHI|nr:acyltransferase [Pedobacter duraquae]TDO19009.1 peptidoglycan/LPS O-acetylase OafA/YrhL [Pedobacter duraquae]
MKRTLGEHVNSKNNNLDFMRFLAAMLVVFSHSYQVTGIIKQEPLTIFSKGYLFLGTFSVIVFFIISGLLIAKSYDYSRSLKSYVMARILRIYPAFVIAIIVTVFVIGPIVTNIPLQSYLTNVNTYEYLYNIFCLKISYHIKGVFESNPLHVINGCLWSLPFELSCYWLVGLIGEVKNKRIYAAFGLFLLLLVVYYFIGYSAWKNIALFTFYFFCGAGYYKFRNKIVLNNYIAFALLIILLTLLYFNVGKHIKDIYIGLALPYILFSFAYIKSIFNNFSKNGDFSYGIYIYGWLVQQAIVQYFPKANHWSNFLFSAGIVLLIAFCSWHLVEKKFLKFKAKF